MPTRYRGRATKHPWVVVVLPRSTDAHVWFRVVQGPGKSLGKTFRLRRTAFEALYERI